MCAQQPNRAAISLTIQFALPVLCSGFSHATTFFSLATAFLGRQSTEIGPDLWDYELLSLALKPVSTANLSFAVVVFIPPSIVTEFSVCKLRCLFSADQMLSLTNQLAM